jgi:hypothetical protein
VRFEGATLQAIQAVLAIFEHSSRGAFQIRHKSAHEEGDLRPFGTATYLPEYKKLG